jgi:hypothetical protein
MVNYVPVEMEKTTPHNVWYDDLVLSSTPVDCPTPPVDCTM